MKKKQLIMVIPEIYSLAVLVLTIPTTTVSAEHSFWDLNTLVLQISTKSREIKRTDFH
jgi:hypothetical protein